MKKFLALCLSLIMVFSMGTVAFAAENSFETEEVESVSDEAVPANIDYYTFSTTVRDGYQTISVTPGSGEALKMHVYLSSGALTVWVRSSSTSSWTKITTWNTIGHHYCDLVSSTNGGTYEIRLFGATSVFEGGVYSGT